MRNIVRQQRQLHRILELLLCLGIVAGLISAFHRGRVEARNRRIEIALDYTELRDLASAEGVPLDHVLKRFQEAGATSVAIQEDTIGSLEDAGRLSVVKGERGGVTLRLDAALFDRVHDAIGFKTPWTMALVTLEPPTSSSSSSSSRRRRRRSSASSTPPSPPPARGLYVNQPYSIVRGLGVGLDPGAVSEVRNAGLGIVGRIGSWDALMTGGLAWSLFNLSKQGASTLVFTGDKTPGFKGHIADDPEKPGQASLENVLRQANLYYGNVEFVKQKGDALAMRSAPDRTVRVHTVSGAEMLTADIPGNIQRFLLASRERNIRLIFVRLFMDEPDKLAANFGYVSKLANGLAKSHLETGLAHGYEPLTTPFYLRLPMALGLAAGWLLLVDALTRFLSGGTGMLTKIAAGGGAVLLFLLPLLPLPGLLGVKAAALAAACIFPTLAIASSDLLRPAPPGESPLVVGLMRFARVTAITIIGIVFIVGLLSDRLFLIKADAFLGVKIAKFLPILAAAVIYGLNIRASRERTWKQAVSEAGEQVERFGTQPIYIWQAVFAVAGLVVLAMVMMRSGNDPGVGVSGMELKIRALLDRFFGVRPRFQEFLVGHPAMICALGLAAHGAARYPPPPAYRLLVTGLFLVGVIGQASLLNTFCHLHTPLGIGVTRAVLGIIIGAILGALAYILIDRFLLAPYRRSARREAAMNRIPTSADAIVYPEPDAEDDAPPSETDTVPAPTIAP